MAPPLPSALQPSPAIVELSGSQTRALVLHVELWRSRPSVFSPLAPSAARCRTFGLYTARGHQVTARAASLGSRAPPQASRRVDTPNSCDGSLPAAFLGGLTVLCPPPESIQSHRALCTARSQAEDPETPNVATTASRMVPWACMRRQWACGCTADPKYYINAVRWSKLIHTGHGRTLPTALALASGSPRRVSAALQA